MKKGCAIVLIVVMACGPGKTNSPLHAVSLSGDCPKQATCTIEMMANKRMLIETTTNGLKYALADQTGMNVIIYKYNKIVKGNIQDAGYREEIIFEYDGKRGAKRQDAQLQNNRMLFGRFCFCEGQTGYFPVSNGTLLADTAGNVQLNLTVTEVPQVIKEIKFAVK